MKETLSWQSNCYEEDLPNLDKLEKEMVCIPVGWWLLEKDLEYIAKKMENSKLLVSHHTMKYKKYHFKRLLKVFSS